MRHDLWDNDALPCANPASSTDVIHKDYAFRPVGRMSRFPSLCLHGPSWGLRHQISPQLMPLYAAGLQKKSTAVVRVVRNPSGCPAQQL